MTPNLVVIARRLSFIRETQGANRGAWVEKLLRECHAQPGDPWCAAYLSFCLDVKYHGKSPILLSAACRLMLSDATMNGYALSPLGVPAFGDLFFVLSAEGVAHHCGLITDTSPLTGLAGNTSPDGQSTNGTGVYEHPILMDRSRLRFVRLP